MSKTKQKIKTFLSDGLSERDFLLIISAGVFFLFVTVGLIMVLFNQQIDPLYLSLLDMVSPVIMVIVGGLFGVNIAETFANRPIRNNRQTEINIDATVVPVENTIENEDDII
jgi:hypothetical protein